MHKNKPILKRFSGRNITQTYSVMGEKSFEYSQHYKTGCPAITIGDNLESGIIFIDESGPLTALINGGEPGYTIGTITGTIPPGFDVAVSELGEGDYYVILDGTATTFGSYTFSLTVLDANNCESDPKTFTIEVWAAFINSTPQVVTVLDNFLIVVSELP